MSEIMQRGPLRFLMVAVPTATIGWALAEALSPPLSASLIIVMVLVTIVEAEASAEIGSRHQITRSQLRWTRAAEIILGLVAVEVGQVLLSEGSGASTIFDVEAIAVWLICIFSWIFVAGAIADLERLGSPGERAPNYRPPLPALTARFLTGGFVVVVAGAFAFVDLARMPDPAREVARGWFWPSLVYFSTVMLILGAIRRQEALLQWQRQRMDVAPEVARRWWAGVGVIVAVATVTMILIPVFRAGSSLSYVYDRVVISVAWAAGGLGIHFDVPAGEAQTVRPELGDGGADLQPGEGLRAKGMVDIVLGFLFLLILVGLALAVLRLLRRVELPTGELLAAGLATGILRILWIALTALPRVLLWALRALWAWLRRIFGDEGTATPTAGRAEHSEEMPSRTWATDDPNRRSIAEAYRRFLVRAGGSLVSRRRSETPREYGRSVSTMVPVAGPVEVLTESFNEARYSDHPLLDGDVARARQALASFEQSLDRSPPD